ncbi:RHS repeat-associated core domain-containing protein [Pseudomonas typographi]|uniref:RHS repeat-associated core domain-containing protein n=1 Tax=Pseudomonas typographi TaxID=2715964 RepID=UPI001685C278|nr:RHS repeat-associated core domain-containing protein [Pseudomonas typographi]MBD1555208.1 hypothetical protein [Pseudomonas typographi]MBD1590320.1 hypothetical protein [Pseudomonas typographi]
MSANGETINNKASLLASNISGTIIQLAHHEQRNYMPFGYFNNRGTHLGLNGDWFEHEFEGYLLGIGHRAFIPNLMRFTTADSQSPFRSGGINSYVYCLADPINLADHEGRSAISLFKGIGNIFGRKSSSTLQLQNNILNRQITHLTDVMAEAAVPFSQDFARRGATAVDAMSNRLRHSTQRILTRSDPFKIPGMTRPERSRMKLYAAGFRQQHIETYNLNLSTLRRRNKPGTPLDPDLTDFSILRIRSKPRPPRYTAEDQARWTNWGPTPPPDAGAPPAYDDVIFR